MDVVGVMAAYLPVALVYSASLDCAVYTRATGKYSYAATTPTMSISTDKIEQLL